MLNSMLAQVASYDSNYSHVFGMNVSHLHHLASHHLYLKWVNYCIYTSLNGATKLMVKLAVRYPGLHISHPKLFIWDKNVPIVAFCTVGMSVNLFHLFTPINLF